MELPESGQLATMVADRPPERTVHSVSRAGLKRVSRQSTTAGVETEARARLPAGATGLERKQEGGVERSGSESLCWTASTQ
jgi:hypothetical protein